MFMSVCLYECLCTKCMKSQKKLEEGIGSPVAEGTNNWEAALSLLGIKPGSLYKSNQCS